MQYQGTAVCEAVVCADRPRAFGPLKDLVGADGLEGHEAIAEFRAAPEPLG